MVGIWLTALIEVTGSYYTTIAPISIIISPEIGSLSRAMQNSFHVPCIYICLTHLCDIIIHGDLEYTLLQPSEIKQKWSEIVYFFFRIQLIRFPEYGFIILIKYLDHYLVIDNGMPSRDDYRKAREWKKHWYAKNGFIEGENHFTTQDDEKGRLDSTIVKEVAETIQNLI